MKKFFIFFTVFILNIMTVFALTYMGNGAVYVLIKDGNVKGIYAMNNLTTKIPNSIHTPAKPVTGLKATPEGKLNFFVVDKNPLSAPANIDVKIPYVPKGKWVGTGKANGWLDTWDPATWVSKADAYQYIGSAYYSHHWAWGKTCYPCWHTPTPKPGTTAGTTGFYTIPNNTPYHSFDRSDNIDEDGNGVIDLIAYIQKQGWTMYPKWCYYNDIPSYFIYQDNVTIKKTNWFLNLLDPTTGAVSKSASASASAEEKYIDRKRINGCHDGCFPGSSKVTVKPDKWISKVTTNVYGDVYFYKRKENSSLYSLKFNNGAIPSGSTVIGNPKSAEFLAVASKGNHVDWIYCLNRNIIKGWMKDAGFSTIGNVDSVAVSDQWWRDGGIVFVYDKSTGILSLIERSESSTTNKVIRADNRVIDSALDDLSSDGYGNVYGCKTTYDPANKNLLVVDYPPAGHIKSAVYSLVSGTHSFEVTLSQSVYKEVIKYDYYSDFLNKESCGKIHIGANEYVVTAVAKNKTDPPSLWQVIGNPVLKNSDNSNLDLEITAINYAVPPKVIGNTIGKLDIDGPYEINGNSINHVNSFSYKTYSTNPGFYATKDSSGNYTQYGLLDNKLFLFAVENYPLPSIKDWKSSNIGNRAINTRSGTKRDSSDGLSDPSSNSLADKTFGPSGLYDIITTPTGNVQVNVKWSNQPTLTQSKIFKGGFVSSLNFSYMDNTNTPIIDESDVNGDGQKDYPHYIWFLYQAVNKYGEDYTIKNSGVGRELFSIESDSPIFGVYLEGGVYDLFVASKYSWFDYDLLGPTSSESDRWQFNKTVFLGTANNKCAITGPKRYYPQNPKLNALGLGNTNWAHHRFCVVSSPPAPPDGIIVAKSGPVIDTGNQKFVVDEDSQVTWQLKDPISDAAKNKVEIMKKAKPPKPDLANYNPSTLQWTTAVQLSIDYYLNKGNVKIGGKPIYKSSSNIGGSALDADFMFTTGLDDPSTPVDESEFLSIPTEPELYTIRMKATRQYSYDAIIKVTIKDDNGNDIKLEQNMKFFGIVTLTGDAKVMVRDILSGDDIVTKSSVAFVNGNEHPIGGFYFTSRDSINWDIPGSTFNSSISNIVPTSLDSTAIYNPSKIKIYFEDDNPFGNKPQTAFSLSYGYVSQGNSPSNTNPTFNGFVSDDTTSGYKIKHTQDFYARLRYDAVIPGVSPTMITSMGYTSIQDMISKFSASNLTYNFWTDYYNTSNLNTISVPKDITNMGSIASDYFQSGFSGSDIVLTADDYGGTKDSKKSYFSLTLDMKKLFKYVSYDFKSYNWSTDVPDANITGLNTQVTVSDGSGNRKIVSLATTNIMDNKQPNVFMIFENNSLSTGNQDFLPRNIKNSTYLKTYSPTDIIYYFTHYNKGDWVFKDKKIGDIDTSKIDNPFPKEDNNKNISVKTLKPVMVMNRIKITLIGVDNICGSSLTAKATLNFDKSDFPFTNGKASKYVIFTKPDEDGYILDGWITDTATDWNGNTFNNKRYFSFEVGPVLKSTIKVHAIESTKR